MAMSELQALLDAAVDAIIVIDDRGAITTFNAAAERLFGYAAAEVLGKPVDLLMPEPYHSEHKGYIDRYLATGEPRIIGIGREVLGRRANGETFPIALSVGEARDANGRRFVGIIRDLSAQKAAELRARSLEGRLAHVGRFDLMGEMAAGIAHEINQPLSAIATYAQAARRILEREQPAMTTLIDVCRKIDEQALRAGRVIENLRKFIKKQDVRTEPLDVNAVVRDIMNLVDADAHAEGIRVTTKYADDLAAVRGNAIQLQQVLLNLTRNAVDAMRGTLNKDLGIADRDAERCRRRREDHRRRSRPGRVLAPRRRHLSSVRDDQARGARRWPCDQPYHRSVLRRHLDLSRQPGRRSGFRRGSSERKG